MKTLAIVLTCSAPVLGQDCGWLQRMPEHGPSLPSNQVEMAFDSARAVSVLFSSSSDIGETLEWDGSDWKVRAEDGPGGRRGTALAYDAKRGVTVLYGGKKAEGEKADTWEWDGQAWTQRTGLTAGDRSEHSMVYDSARGVMVLFGGRYTNGDDSHLLGDTWEWDGIGKWVKVANSGPRPRVGSIAAYDATRGVTVLYGGVDESDLLSDTWEWDGQMWTQRDVQGPGPLASATMVYDADLHACVLFGGGRCCGFPLSDETWTWEGQKWTQLDTPQAPPRRYSPAMDYDSARHAVVLFGGDNVVGDPIDDTWEFTCFSPPCYPDLDGNGSLDLFDFLCFTNAFNAGC